MATHSSVLAWRILMDRGAWWVTVHRIEELDRTEATQHMCTFSRYLWWCDFIFMLLPFHFAVATASGRAIALQWSINRGRIFLSESHENSIKTSIYQDEKLPSVFLLSYVLREKHGDFMCPVQLPTIKVEVLLPRGCSKW